MTVREAYLNRQQLAAHLGLSLRTITKFDGEGMPSHRWGPRTVRYRLSECEAWLAERGRASVQPVAQLRSVAQQGRHPTAPGTNKRSSTDA